MPKKSLDNFDPKREMQSIQNTLGKIIHPDQFATVFCNAARAQSNIKECLAESVRDVLIKDKKIDKYIQDMFRKVINDDKKLFMINIGRGARDLFFIIFGSILTFILNLLAKKLGI
ncbi:MAG: hypothetical protein LBD62_04330 [Candidatus Margulisbacteria bacterium]|jgi:hypothetical protein|nr:hypothetical protein [Candidatus Margulisiibacteriota bacterium]